MNDPIKDFIEKNRAEFDHLEAPAFDLNKFKAGLPAAAPKKGKVIALFPKAKWLVAASVVAAMVTIGLLTRKATLDPQVQTAQNNTPAVKPVEKPADKGDVEAAKNATSTTDPNAITTAKAITNSIATTTAKASTNNIAANQKTQKSATGPSDNRTKKASKALAASNASLLYAQLADSTSASNRLSAILSIDDKANVSYDLFQKLASTLNHDGNSNVRLAALGVMKKYTGDAYVSSLLVSSLNTQLDPMVQLELVNILGKMEHLKIEDKLYALASDPNTFDAVKDEAYNILLNQNKL